MANNYHRPEKVRFVLSDMKRMGGRTLAYAEQLEDLLNPLIEQRLRQRETSKIALRKYRLAHPEYRKKCIETAKAAYERNKLRARIERETENMVMTNPFGTAISVKDEGLSLG